MNTTRPLVSVVMPAYNAERHLRSAVRSVQQQTFTDWELLVIDDASRDATSQIVAALARADARIRLVRNPHNLGVADTRNKGLQLAAGEYIAFLDSDDRWFPRKLELQLELLRARQADLVYSSYAIVDENDTKICPDYIVPPSVDYAGLLTMNVIGCSTVMVSRRALRGFSFPAEHYHEDYALWLLLLRAGRRAAGLQQVLVEYRLRAGGRAANKGFGAWQRWRLYRSLLKLSFGQSVLHSVQYAWNGLRKYRPVRR